MIINVAIYTFTLTFEREKKKTIKFCSPSFKRGANWFYRVLIHYLHRLLIVERILSIFCKKKKYVNNNFI